jgi:hypothetical protein
MGGTQIGVSENKVVRRLLGPKQGEDTRGC